MELKEIADKIQQEGWKCNCDLDNWEPENSTGHSHVCRIHKATMAVKRGDRPMPQAPLQQQTEGKD